MHHYFAESFVIYQVELLLMQYRVCC